MLSPGEFLDTIEGRVLNPGHAIEAGWFILGYARTYCASDPALVALGLNMIDWSLELGSVLYPARVSSATRPPSVRWGSCPQLLRR